MHSKMNALEKSKQLNLEPSNYIVLTLSLYLHLSQNKVLARLLQHFHKLFEVVLSNEYFLNYYTCKVS